MTFLSRLRFRAIMICWLFLMPMTMAMYYALGMVLVPIFSERREAGEFMRQFRGCLRSLPGRYATTLREIRTGEPAPRGPR